MERRQFLTTAVGAAAAGGLFAGCASEMSAPNVVTQKQLRWQLASSFPRSLDTIFGAADHLADRVKELTDGRFTIKVYPAGEVVPGLQVLDAVQNGTVEIGHSASYYYKGKEAALAFDTAVPFGLTARQQTAWLCEAGGLKLIRDLLADFDVTSFPGGNTGVQMGGWFREPVTSVEDLRGLKMRIPGLGGEVMKRLGVTVQNIPGGEIYTSLESGAIDATEWVGPYDDQKLAFHRVAKNYHYPGWWEPGPALSFFVSRSALDSLPSTYRAALETAAAEVTLKMMNEYDAKNPRALQELLADGVNLVRFPDDVLVAAEEATQELHSEFVAKDPKYRTVYEHWEKFRKLSGQWMATAEQAYADHVFGRG